MENKDTKDNIQNDLLDNQKNESKTNEKSNLKELDKPLSLLIIGMAGSGKTTFMGGLIDYLKSKGEEELLYSLNLDPAVQFLPYVPDNDIRSKVNYKDVMKKYGLGPNGAIMTSLNLYAAQFHEALEVLEENQKSKK